MTERFPTLSRNECPKWTFKRRNLDLNRGWVWKRLQKLMGHSSLNTTLIYLQVSEIPHTPDFSPLDKWEDESPIKGI